MRRFYTDGTSYESGSINKSKGGTTVGKNGVVRARVVPVNPKTTTQQENRNLFRFLTSSWSQLTEVQRKGWEGVYQDALYAKQDPLTGTSRSFGSAKSLFIAMNTNYSVAQGLNRAPNVQYALPGSPTGGVPALDAITNVTVTMDASSRTCELAYDGAWSGEVGFLRITDPVSAGTSRIASVKSRFRNVETGITSASPVDCSANYENTFGVLVGKGNFKVFWELEGVNIATGLKRVIASGVTIITP